MDCDQCNGTGEPNNNLIDYNKKFYYIMPKNCDKCHGSGKLDWIEAVVGKKPETNIISTGAFSGTLDHAATTVTFDENFKQEIVDEAVKKMTIIIDEKMTKLLEGQICK